ncbi:MAG: transcription termination factor Rho [Lachnospiraceae bacterium]|nr:transcription termination factor Rho [Lachnospiraceae bacterium]
MSLSALREAAKNSGIKGVTSLRKPELIELLKKESASIEKAAEKLEKFAAEDEQKAGGEAAAAKHGRAKKTEETSNNSTKVSNKKSAVEQNDEKAESSKKVSGGNKKNIKNKENAGSELADAIEVAEDTPEEDLRKDNAGSAANNRKKAGKDPNEKAKRSEKTVKEDVTKQSKQQDKVQQTPKQSKSQEITQSAPKKDQPQENRVNTQQNQSQEKRVSTQQSQSQEDRVNAQQSQSQENRANTQQNQRQNQQEAQQNQQNNRNLNAQGRYQQDQGRPIVKPGNNNGNFGNDRSNQGQQYNTNATEGKIVATTKITTEEREALDPKLSPEVERLDSGDTKMGILEVMPEGFGFIRCDNFLPGENDVYVSPAQIRKFNLKTGDIISGNTKVRLASEKFCALLYIKTINGIHPNEAIKRKRFEELTPVFPHDRIRLETRGCIPALRIVDLLSPIGKGQRGMIVSQPKAGKTTLLKQIAKAMQTNYPDLHIIILLIDERPEEVTDMKESIQGSNVEVIYSTFDELPENHKRVSEMAIERAKRLVEHGRDVVVLLDSITRLARAYNLTCQPSGRTLSGGLDPAALHMPKKFFGAARCMREGGSLTVLATALVETGSRMDDVVFEEFKGTGNMELVLDRNLSERRIFPAIDLPRSSTRREDLLLNKDEIEANNILRRAFNSSKAEDVVEKIINMFARTRTNAEFIDILKNTRL